MNRLTIIVAAVGMAACGANKPPDRGGDDVVDPGTDKYVVPWEASGIDWNTRPTPGPNPEIRVPTAKSLSLDNGMRIVVIENARLPLVSIQLINPLGGSLFDSSSKQGLAAITADLLDEGAGDWATLALADRAEELGAELSVSAGTDAMYIEINTLTDTLDDSVALLAAIVRKPRFTAEDFARVKSNRLTALRRRRDEASAIASLVFDRVVFGAHAYSHPAGGFPDTLARIELADVRDFYANHYAPEHMTIVIAGDVDARELKATLHKHLGTWSRRALKPGTPNLRLPRAGLPRIVVVDKPKATQSVVWLGRSLMKRNDPRYYPATVANTMLGGSFTSRLNNRLREQLGYTYGAESSFWYGRHAGSWTVSTSLERKHTIAGIREMLRIVNEMRTTDAPAAELSRAKSLLVRDLPQTFETNSGTVGAFTTLAVEGLPVDWYASFLAGVRATSSSAARAFAAAHWGRDQTVLVVVGDLRSILHGLLALGLGSVLQLDPDGNVVRVHRRK